MENLTTKKCPFCNEDINIEAKKCRHCGKWLSDYKDVQESSSADRATDVLFGCIIPLLKIAVPLLIAFYTVPSNLKLKREAVNSAVECIVESYSNNELVNVLGGKDLWSALVSANRAEIKNEFVRRNSIKIERKWFWSSAIMYNERCPEGETIMFSLFSFNIPMIDIDDIVL